MSREFKEELVVYIWKFGGIGNLSHFGHAAIKLKGGDITDPMGDQGKCYISYWPTEAGLEDLFKTQTARPKFSPKHDYVAELSQEARHNLAMGKYEPREGQFYLDKSVTKPFLMMDENQWGQKPDVKVHLPASTTPEVQFGLDMGAMARWWAVFAGTPNPKYVLADTNCAKVAGLALEVGGAADYCSPPALGKGFWTPNTVLSWAEDLKAALEKKNAEVQEIQKALTASGPTLSTGLSKPDLLDLKLWKAHSAAGTGALSWRKDQVKAIDQLLERYAPVAQAATEEGLKTAIQLLADILEQVHDHLRLKGVKSDRHAAVLAIGEQALAAHTEKTRAYNDLNAPPKPEPMSSLF